MCGRWTGGPPAVRAMGTLASVLYLMDQKTEGHELLPLRQGLAGAWQVWGQRACSAGRAGAWQPEEEPGGGQALSGRSAWVLLGPLDACDPGGSARGVLQTAGPAADTRLGRPRAPRRAARVKCTQCVSESVPGPWGQRRAAVPELTSSPFRHAATKGILVAMVCTFFEAFNVPVFWPILVMYFVMLFCITMKRQIKVKASRLRWERRARRAQACDTGG